MPTDDTIFARLRSATDAELRGIARSLEVSLSGAHEVDIVGVSKELRSAGGNSFANVFRQDHELSYRSMLDDIVKAAGSAAGFTRRSPGETAREQWLEEYILRAMTFASRPDLSTVSNDERADAQRAADAALQGEADDAGLDGGEVARLGVLAGGGVAVALGVGALPFGLAFIALKWASPAVKKTLPAVLYLIHVRKRQEAEDALRREDGE